MEKPLPDREVINTEELFNQMNISQRFHLGKGESQD